MPPVTTVETEVYADHTQFYVYDPASEGQAGSVWDGSGLERHVGVSTGIVAVATIGHCDLPVRIEVWDEEPPRDLEDWDHVVDVGLDVLSGRVVLGEIGGPVEHDPIAVEPGTYRVRSSAAGLDHADELEGGDRYRIQLWPAPEAEPVVLRWWDPWDPSEAVASPTTPGGRILLGAEALDARNRMQVLASRLVAHLYRDAEGTLWESAASSDAGTLQLEVVDHAEAERRYGPVESWSTGVPGMPTASELLRNISDTLRYRQGWRPEPNPTEPVLEDGRRVYVGNTAATRLLSMAWVTATEGDNLHVDEDGTYWERPWRSGHREQERLRELSREEAEAKYGELG